MCRLIAALFTCFLVMLPVLPAYSDNLMPRRYTGAWGLTGCSADDQIALVNPGGVILFNGTGPKPEVAVGDAVIADGKLKLEREDGHIRLGTIDKAQRCRQLPGIYHAYFGEAIALFREIDRIARRCHGGGGRVCIDAAFRAADVTNDGRLSEAEINRVMRAASFFVGYEMAMSEGPTTSADRDNRDILVKAEKLYPSSGASMLISPVFANNIISAYDYNDDGLISINELLQDRPADSLAGAGGAIGTAAMETILRTLTRVGGQVFQQILSLSSGAL